MRGAVALSAHALSATTPTSERRIGRYTLLRERRYNGGARNERLPYRPKPHPADAGMGFLLDLERCATR
jgi:hypothetical protein